MIELSRNITFGQYISNDSTLVHMDPRAKLLCTIVLIALVSYAGTFTAFALCLLGCFCLQAISRIPIAYILRSFQPIVLILGIIYVIQVILYASPTQHTTLLWHWGIFSISWEGMSHSAIAILRALFLYYLTSMLLFTTSLIDLTDGMEALLSPLQKLGIPVNAFVMVLVIAFKFVPIFVAEVERLTKAQAARGVRFDQGNFISRAVKLAPLLIPLIVNGFQRADTLAIAMEARCYRPGQRGWRRSKRRELRLHHFDALALLLVLVFCIVTILVNVAAPF